jgi:hypothetical protein
MCGSVHAGYVIEVSYRDHATGGSPARLTTFLDQRKAKIDSTALTGGRSAIIYDRDLERVVQVRYPEQQYVQFDTAKLNAVHSGVRSTVDFLQEQFDRVDMKVFETSEEKKVAYKLNKTGQQRVIDGLPCREVQVYGNGELLQTIWYTTWEQAGIRKSSLIGLIKLGEFYERLWEMPGAERLQDSLMQVPVEGIIKLTGYPVLIEVYQNRRKKLSIQLGKPRELPLRPAVFEVPRGYKRVML